MFWWTYGCVSEAFSLFFSVRRGIWKDVLAWFEYISTLPFSLILPRLPWDCGNCKGISLPFPAQHFAILRFDVGCGKESKSKLLCPKYQDWGFIDVWILDRIYIYIYIYKIWCFFVFVWIFWLSHVFLKACGGLDEAVYYFKVGANGVTVFCCSSKRGQ